MRISRDTHLELLALFASAASTDPAAAQAQEDVDAVRAAITPADGDALLGDDDRDALFALNRLLEGRPGFTRAKLLLRSARFQGILPPYRGIDQLVEQRRRIIADITDEESTDPALLAQALHQQRAAFIAAENARSLSPGWTTQDFPLTTLVLDLQTIARGPSDFLTATLYAGALDLFLRSPILQSLDLSEVTSPQGLYETLERIQQDIAEEQAAIERRRGPIPAQYSVTTLMNALAMGGRLPLPFTDELHRRIQGRVLYQRSPLLQGIPQAVLDSPLELAHHLAGLRHNIEQEQSLRTGNPPQPYSLLSFIYAFEGADVLGDDIEKYEQAAFALDIYLHSPSLQGIPADDVASPEAAIDALARLRPTVLQELAAARPQISLATLAMAVIVGRRIERSSHRYVRRAGARDLYDRSPLLQGLRTADLATPESLVQALLLLRPMIIEEQNALRGQHEFRIERYALNTLAEALGVAGRLPRDSQTYERFAGARDLYDHSPVLQGIDDAALSDPIALVGVLAALRPAIVEEQRALRGADEEDAGDYALSTLVKALSAGGRIERNLQKYTRLASGWDLFDRSPTLQALPREIAALRDHAKLMRFLLARRDRVAVENRLAIGELPPGAFLFPGAENHYALGTLIDALFAAGVVRSFAEYNEIVSAAAGPLEYVWKRRAEIEAEIRRLIATGREQGLSRIADPAVFVPLAGPPRPMSDKYVRNIIKWGRWFFADPDIATRSVYGGDELSALVFEGHRNLANAAPDAIARRMLAGAAIVHADSAGGRREVVSALDELLDHYDGFARAGIELDAELTAQLSALERLFEWNRDALGESRAPSDDSSPPPATPNDRGNGPAPAPPQNSTASPIGGIVVIDDAARTEQGSVPPDAGWPTIQTSVPTLGNVGPGMHAESMPAIALATIASPMSSSFARR